MPARRGDRVRPQMVGQLQYESAETGLRLVHNRRVRPQREAVQEHTVRHVQLRARAEPVVRQHS